MAPCGRIEHGRAQQDVCAEQDEHLQRLARNGVRNDRAAHRSAPSSGDGAGVLGGAPVREPVVMTGSGRGGWATLTIGCGSCWFGSAPWDSRAKSSPETFGAVRPYCEV